MKKLALLIFCLYVLIFVLISRATTLSVRRIVNVNSPPMPTNFVLTLLGNNTTNVFLTWVNAATNYDNIVIERSVTPPSWTVITNLAGTATAFTNNYTWTNAATFYRIKAVRSGLSSLYNNQP